MKTLLTGRACQGSVWLSIHSTNRALPYEVVITSPSTPAVLRPALSCVTRRTLNSTFERDRSINFCKLRTFFRSPALLAVKILCRRRRTSSSTARQLTASQSKTSPVRSVRLGLRRRVQLALRFRYLARFAAQAHQIHVSALAGREHAHIQPVMPTPRRRSRAAESRFPLPSAAGIRFLDLPVPPGNSASLTVGLPAPMTPILDPAGVSTFHTHETRPGWAPSLSRGRWCPPSRAGMSSRHLPLLNGQPLLPRCRHPPRSIRSHETSTKGSLRSPVRSSPRP